MAAKVALTLAPAKSDGALYLCPHRGGGPSKGAPTTCDYRAVRRMTTPNYLLYMNTDNMNRAADNIRILAASMVEKPDPDTPVAPWAAPISSTYSLPSF